jgi:hypothetical protein
MGCLRHEAATIIPNLQVQSSGRELDLDPDRTSLRVARYIGNHFLKKQQ